MATALETAYVAIIVGIVVLFVSLLGLIFLRWRFAFSDGALFVAPAKDWADHLDQLRRELKKLDDSTRGLSNTQDQQQTKINKTLDNLHSEIKELKEIQSTLRTELSSQQQELEQYRRGYDAHLRKQAILPICRIHKTLTEYAASYSLDEAGQAFLEYFLQDCRETLEGYGISIVEPEPDSRARDLNNIRRPPCTEPTEEPARVGKVKNVKAPAYELDAYPRSEVVIPAEVVVYAEPTSYHASDEPSETNASGM